MAMGLSATDYEVIDLRPQAFGSWIEGHDTADALILDLESPKLAVAAVTNLRAHAKLAPVLLVSSDRPGWDDPEMRQLPSAEVLPLPISRPALLSALEDLLVEPWASVSDTPVVPVPLLDEPQDRQAPVAERAPAAEAAEHRAATADLDVVPPQHAEVTAALLELSRDPAELLSEDDELEALLHAPIAPPHAAEPREVDAVQPDVVQPEVLTADAEAAAAEAPIQKAAIADRAPVEPPAALAPPLRRSSRPPAADAPAKPVQEAESHPLSAVPRTRRVTRMPAATTGATIRELEALRPTATPAAAAERAAEPEPRRRSERHRPAAEPAATTSSHASALEDDAVSLVRRLARVTNTLYGVPETAEVVILDAVERTHADAGALLVPDEGSWRVAAGVGLRPLEHRYELHEESWLVQQVARAHKGAIIEESDIARDQLQGAPLASWRHLLSAPVPAVEALILLARREDPPFDEGDLTVLATLGQEAGSLLAAAIDTRSLARTMWEVRDEADLPR
jgi:hypothetical protein